MTIHELGRSLANQILEGQESTNFCYLIRIHTEESHFKNLKVLFIVPRTASVWNDRAPFGFWVTRLLILECPVRKKLAEMTWEVAQI